MALSNRSFYEFEFPSENIAEKFRKTAIKCVITAVVQLEENTNRVMIRLIDYQHDMKLIQQIEDIATNLGGYLVP